MKENAISFQRFDIKREVRGGFSHDSSDVHVRKPGSRYVCPLAYLFRFVQDCEDIIINRMYSAAPSEVEPLGPQASSLPNKQKPSPSSLLRFCKYVAHMSRQTLNWLLTHTVFLDSHLERVCCCIRQKRTWCNPVSQSSSRRSGWAFVFFFMFSSFFCVIEGVFLFVLIRRVFSKRWLITPAKSRLQCDTSGCRESILSINLRCGFNSFSGLRESVGKTRVSHFSRQKRHFF